MSGSGILILVVIAMVVALPLATFYRPFAAGVLGVAALTASAVFFTISGKSAMTETTAAVFAVGAFLLAGILALARVVTEVRDALETKDET